MLDVSQEETQGQGWPVRTRNPSETRKHHREVFCYLRRRCDRITGKETAARGYGPFGAGLVTLHHPDLAGMVIAQDVSPPGTRGAMAAPLGSPVQKKTRPLEKESSFHRNSEIRAAQLTEHALYAVFRPDHYTLAADHLKAGLGTERDTDLAALTPSGVHRDDRRLL